MQFQLDSSSSGVRFYNVTAQYDNDQILFSGLYNSAELIPVLLFSMGVQWVEPCVKHVCCLWDVATRYRDHDLMQALGPTCNEKVDLRSKDLMKGNNSTNQFNVRTMIHPTFIAMLFLCTAPAFHMYYEIVPIKWLDSNIRWSASWYGQPCHKVRYPDGRDVCIYCANAKPDNAVYSFTVDWFQTFKCPWTCRSGYMGPNCEIGTDTAIYASIGVAGASCIAGVLTFVFARKREVVIKPHHLELEPVKAMKTAEMIEFKENFGEIRIKLL
jgi:hypothetical protein